MKRDANILLWGTFAVSLLLWVLSKSSIGAIIDTPLKSLTQISAIFGATGFLIEYLLSSRLPSIEKWFLPLDKSYRLHRIVGTFSAAGILFHVTSLIVSLLPSPLGITVYLLPGTILAYNFGIFAFYGLLLIIFTTFYSKLPYSVWKFFHVITGFSLPLVILHVLLVPSDVSQTFLLKAWFVVLSSIALFGWIFRLVIYRLQAFRHHYVVNDIQRESHLTIITMKVVANALVATAGQFAFFRFFSQHKKLTQEAHPFSLLHCTEDSISIAIKHLGDYTMKTQQLEVGDTVAVTQAYGGFGKDFAKSEKPAVWIAGGIGVIPFISLLQNIKHTKNPKSVSFFLQQKSKIAVLLQ